MPSNATTDVAIIGGGPGGVATALTLAKAGIASTLLEKAAFPRDKICGDAISGKVVATLNRIDPNLVPQLKAMPAQVGSWGVSFIAPNRKVLRIPFKRDYDTATDMPPGFISKRWDFDHFLWQAAAGHSSITTKENWSVNDLSRTADGWLVQNKQGDTIAAKLVVIANGAQSSFSRSIGGIQKNNRHYCAGIRTYWTGVTGLENDNFIELHFVKDFLPGYLWIFPLPNGQANVGVGMRSDYISKRKVNLKEGLLHLLQKDPIFAPRFANAEMVDTPKGFGLPLGGVKRPISGTGYLMVGDAASLIDPFTGEGIGNAIISGQVAGETAANALLSGDTSSAALAAYDNEVYRKLGRELQLSYRMQQLVNYPWLFNLVVNKASNNATLRETISCMFEDLDMRQRLKQPGFYWRLLFGGKSA